MRDRVRRYRVESVVTTVRAALLGISLVALAGSAFAAEYKMTVNKDRLINAGNEPQNWLMMNGDYGSTRYSKLTQINRDNVKNLRMVWALALRGMGSFHIGGREAVVAGRPVLDLDYPEDSTAQTDMNVVMTGDGRFVEVQGTAEGAGAAFDRTVLGDLLDLATTGCAELTRRQQEALAAPARERLA